MKVTVCYTTVPGKSDSLQLATRFVATYNEHTHRVPHARVAIFNRELTSVVDNALRATMACWNSIMFERSNYGWDIGGYIQAASSVEQCASADLMICFGESVYFHKAGWMERIIDCYSGPGIYGLLSSNVLRPHLPTTAFAATPELLRKYPWRVSNKAERYRFEHGENSFMNWIKRKSGVVKFVSFDGCFGELEWRHPENIMWKGNQSNCLVWCNHTDRYTQSNDTVKALWRRLAG